MVLQPRVTSGIVPRIAYNRGVIRYTLALVPLVLLATTPSDIDGGLRGETATVQKAADRFSWQEFLALNEPAGAGRLWESWKAPEEVFLAHGQEPTEWGSLPVERALVADEQAVKGDGTLPGVLTDQKGRIVRYEVRMNRTLFDYIRSHRLYESRVQAQTDSVAFPNGAILVKAAWRELTADEAPRFLTTTAWVYDLKDGKPVHRRRRLMGLVGFHIVQKTPSAPQWVWSTFEHVDNVTGTHPSFARTTATTPVNTQTRPGTPSQLTRLTPIGPVALNQEQQAALAQQKSVLANYQLINTQWPRPEQSEGTNFVVEPRFLANTSMESFAPETSCMGCHAMARTSRTDKTVSSDFTFTLRRAQPELTNPRVIPAPKAPTTAWEKANWSAIQRGNALAERTYELLPQRTRAKLHCGSCHLDNGRNPSSSPWIGMLDKYKYPATTQLYSRINQCFERSMNGKPLPGTSTSAEGPEMHAFITYFQWLDTQAQLQGGPLPPTGMPAIEKKTGDPERGKAIFLQKCGSCHGNDGQGRYGSGAYYRPALWGEHSFNDLAGLHAKPEKLAGFLKANMPFGSGGILTAQEAWDLTVFLGKQPRPHKETSP